MKWVSVAKRIQSLFRGIKEFISFLFIRTLYLVQGEIITSHDTQKLFHFPEHSSIFAFSSSAASASFTLMSVGQGAAGSVCFGSTGGLGTHTSITLFFPTLVVGICEVRRMLSRTLPRFVSALIRSWCFSPSTGLM